MHVLLVNKDGSHINKSDIPLLSAFLDLIKQYDGIKQVGFDATFDFSNSRFFEPISIPLDVRKIGIPLYLLLLLFLLLLLL